MPSARTPLSAPLAALLAAPPETGHRNDWIMRVAAKALRIASPEKVRAFLLQVANLLGWDDRNFEPEIDRAIGRVLESMGKPESIEHRATWPEPNHDARRSRMSFPPLFEMSPSSVLSSSAALSCLFTRSTLVCVARDVRTATTAPFADFQLRLHTYAFVVPNPMRAVAGLTTDGKLSVRCLANAVLPEHRRYVVVEFDQAELFEAQIAVLSSLNCREIPLIMAVHSGNKSIHGWYDAGRVSPYLRERFFRHAVYLGADKTLWNPAALVRMPGGTRDDGRTQPILYFREPLP